jgi:hypothetical protein
MKKNQLLFLFINILFLGCKSAQQNNNVTAEIRNNEYNHLDFDNLPISPIPSKRKVVYRAASSLPLSENGKAVVKVCINPAGDVIYSKYLYEESTISKPTIVRKITFAASQYKYEKDPQAPEAECGRLTITFDKRSF